MFLYPIGSVNPSQVWTLRHEMLFDLMFSTAIVLPRYRFILFVIWILAPILFQSLVTTAPANGFEELQNFLFNRFNLLFGLGFLCCIVYLRRSDLFKPRVKFGLFGCAVLCVLYTLILTLIDYSAYETGKVIVAGIAAAAILYVGLSINEIGASTTVIGSEKPSGMIVCNLLMSWRLRFRYTRSLVAPFSRSQSVHRLHYNDSSGDRGRRGGTLLGRASLGQIFSASTSERCTVKTRD